MGSTCASVTRRPEHTASIIPTLVQGRDKRGVTRPLRSIAAQPRQRDETLRIGLEGDGDVSTSRPMEYERQRKVTKEGEETPRKERRDNVRDRSEERERCTQQVCGYAAVL